MAKDDRLRAEIEGKLLGGRTVNSLAREYKGRVSKTTIANWANEQDPVKVAKAELAAGRDFGEMMGRMLEQTLDGMARIAEQTRDPQWMRRQTGADLAELHTALSDNAARVLGAAARAQIPIGADRGLPQNAQR